eukprot:5864931-Pyramimonas_sp.AAC.1
MEPSTSEKWLMSGRSSASMPAAPSWALSLSSGNWYKYENLWGPITGESAGIYPYEDQSQGSHRGRRVDVKGYNADLKSYTVDVKG